MPENDKECVADSAYYKAEDVGRTLTLTDSNDKDTLKTLKNKEMKIVGIVDSPLNMRMGSLSSELGSGEVAGLFYAPESAFTSEYYSEIFLAMDVTGQIYSDEYDTAIKKHTDAVTALTEKCVDERYDDIIKTVNEGREKAEKAVAMAKQGVAQAKAHWIASKHRQNRTCMCSPVMKMWAINSLRAIQASSVPWQRCSRFSSSLWQPWCV